MITETSGGQAYRAGELVAADVLVLEHVEITKVRVLMPGGQTGHKERSIRHPSSIRFESIDDEALYKELVELIAGACDVARAREQRDRRWEPRPLDLILDYERSLVGCRLSRPFEALRVAPEAVAFPIHHEQL